MSKIDEIQKLHKLRESGAITEEEFQKLKNEQMNQSSNIADQITQATKNINEKDWGLIIHLSQFAGYAIPLFGFILPIAIWIVKKSESEMIDQHGRVVINWIISETIYTLIAIVLMTLLIGYPLFIILIVMGLIFPIVGALKAKDGIVWTYPTSIRFFSLKNNN